MNLFEDFDGYIFDFDGTLVDSMGFWVDMYVDTAKKYGFSDSKEYLEILNSMSITEGAKDIKNRYNIQIEANELARIWIDKIYNNYKNDIKLKPYVKEVLFKLKKNSKRIAISTATDKNLCEVCLKQNGVLDYFEYIITVNDVGVGKSSPLIYNKTANLINSEIDKTVIFEDSKIGLLTATKSGYYTIGIEDTSIKDKEPYICKRLIKSFKELL